MNPARSLGPALFAGGSSLASVWIYFVGPFVGAILAVGVYQAIRGGDGNVKDVLEEVPGKEQKHPTQSKPQETREATPSAAE